MLKLLFLFLFSLASFEAAVVSCPSGFKLVNQNKCLKVFPNSSKHLEAETDCRQFGGTLVNIQTAIDNRAVVNFAANAGASYTWIGVFCFGNDTSTCYHDDGSGALAYNNFAAGFPKIDNRFGGCVYMPTYGKTLGQWFTGPCQVSGLPYVCEVPTTFDDPTCTHNYNGYCYLPSHELPNTPLPTTTFAEAMVICEEYGGAKLASVHSKREVDYIRGIYKGASFTNIFLGGKAYVNRVFGWVDDTRWNYDYYDPFGAQDYDCLQMDTSNRENNGMWSKTDCEEVNYFLCKKYLGDTIQTVNPKFSSVKSIQLDAAQCNTTLYLAPGTVTSIGYPGTPTSYYCSWKLAVLGPYRLGLYFTDFSIDSQLIIYDEHGNILSQRSGSQNPFHVLAPTNMVTMTQNSSGQGGYHGFSATILPF